VLVTLATEWVIDLLSYQFIRCTRPELPPPEFESYALKPSYANLSKSEDLA
jgi:hypothetical protein